MFARLLLIPALFLTALWPQSVILCVSEWLHAAPELLGMHCAGGEEDGEGCSDERSPDGRRAQPSPAIEAPGLGHPEDLPRPEARARIVPAPVVESAEHLERTVVRLI